METCTVETGLLKKKPCGEASVTHCANCEQPLCAKHAVPQLTDTGKKSGKFMCKDCSVAQRDIEKSQASAAEHKKEAATAAKHAKAPVAPAGKPAAPASPPPAAAKPKEEDSLGGIDFTPGGGDKK